MTSIDKKISHYARSHKAQLRVLALLLAFWFTWSQAVHIRDFIKGFLDGYSEVEQSHQKVSSRLPDQVFKPTAGVGSVSIHRRPPSAA